LRRTEDQPGPRNGAVTALEDREAEVGEDDAAVVGQQDVAGLDVAVQDAGEVGGLERGQHVDADHRGPIGWQGALFGDHLVQRS
jgi:hypothetical protein